MDQFIEVHSHFSLNKKLIKITFVIYSIEEVHYQFTVSYCSEVGCKCQRKKERKSDCVASGHMSKNTYHVFVLGHIDGKF